MARLVKAEVECIQRMIFGALLICLAFLTKTNGESARTSREFFALLEQPDVENIYLSKDIELKLEDAPPSPVNLTRSISIISGAPEPLYTSFSANYITNKIRLQPGISITFNRILLSGILRGTAQHLDLLSKSDGGAVLFVNSINHRAACLPFDAFYNQLQSLPAPVAEAGTAGQQVGAPRNISVRNGSFCWQLVGDSPHECHTPYLDMYAYGTYNQISDMLVPANGGYNSFFVRSHGVCDKPVSEECLKQRGGDLCLAAAVAALASPVDGVDGSSSPQKSLPLGLGIGFGGALLLAVVFIAVFAWRQWRHRKASRAEGLDSSKRSLGSRTNRTGYGSQTGGADRAAALQDLEKASDEDLAVAAAVVPASAESRRPAAGGGVVREGISGADGKEDLAAPTTIGSTVMSSGGSSSSSSSGVTIEASSGAVTYRPGDVALAAAPGGLSEVEVARLNLLANAAKGRGGRSAPLEVKVLQLLGQGSFGKVYKGIWHGTLVALKAQVLPPSLSGDARRRHMAVMEAAVSSAINHPAIVQTYCYSFRPIKDSVSRTVIKHARSATMMKVVKEGAAAFKGTGNVVLEDEEAGEAAGNEDYGHELLLVLEYCDAGSLREALDKGTFHQGRPWPWDWRRAIQAAGLAAAADGAGGRAAPLRQPPPPPQQQQPLPYVAAALGAAPPIPPATTPDGNKVHSDATTASNSTKGVGGGGAGGGAGSHEPACAGSGEAAAVRPPLGSSSSLRQSHSLVQQGQEQPQLQQQQQQPQRQQPASAALHATDLPNDVWPALDAYEPDFTQGVFEVIVRADDTDGSTPTTAPAATTAQQDLPADANTDATTPSAAVPPDAPPDALPQAGGCDGGAEANTFVSNMLAGAPTAASSFMSFSNLMGSAASAADNAAAAAAADRLAMMYLLQQAAAAAAATTADPGAGGYAKLLADFVSASNLTGFSSFSGLQGSGGGGGNTATGEAAAAQVHSSEGTLVAPPPEVVAATAAGTQVGGGLHTDTTTNNNNNNNINNNNNNKYGCSTNGSCASQAQQLLSQGSDLRSAGSGAAMFVEGGRPPPAIRYGLMLAVAADIASGLLHLHEHGVVHGDVKASNVLMKQIVVSEPWEAAGRALDTLSTPTHAASTTPGTAAATSVADGPPAASLPQSPPSRHQVLPPTLAAAAAAAAGTASPEVADRGGPRLGLCAKVSDFGLSTMLSASNTDTHISATTAAGSLSHMSPELLLCGHVSKANDVYAYGVLLYELFTGERAYEGMPRALLPARVALEGWRPVFPPHTPAAYRQLAERCWLADPAKRPHFKEIVADIRSMREVAIASELAEWLTVPGPQLAFLQQLMQRRPTASLSTSPLVHGQGPAAGQQQQPYGQGFSHSPRPHPMPLQQQQQVLPLQQQAPQRQAPPPPRPQPQS